MLFESKYGNSFFHINLEYLLKEIVKCNFFLFVFEEIFRFDIIRQLKSSLALGVDIVQHVDA